MSTEPKMSDQTIEGHKLRAEWAAEHGLPSNFVILTMDEWQVAIDLRNESVRLVNEMRKKIAYLRAQERCWIPCCERLPDSDKKVVAWVIDFEESMEAKFIHGAWVDAHELEINGNVSAWQEWPKDPEPSAEEKSL